MFGKSEDQTYGISRKERILTYGLEDWQLDLLSEVVKVEKIKDRELEIFVSEEFTDIFAIAHFMAFLNFAAVQEKDQQMFLSYWLECTDTDRSEIPDEFLDDLNTRMPLTYILNCGLNEIIKMPYLFFDNKIFENKSKLRLSALQEIKNLEGKGRMANENHSQKLERILLMYQFLVYKGWLTREKADQLFIDKYRLRDDPLSLRMFQRDMQIIRNIDGNVRYDQDSKMYILDWAKK